MGVCSRCVYSFASICFFAIRSFLGHCRISLLFISIRHLWDAFVSEAAHCVLRGYFQTIPPLNTTQPVLNLHLPSSILKICHACFDLHARTFVDNKVGVQTHEHSPSREADGKISREQGRRLNRLRKIGRRSSAY